MTPIARKQAKIYVQDGGKYSLYQNLYLKVESTTDSFLTFTVTVNGVSNTSRILVINDIAEMQLSDKQFDSLKENPNQLLPLSQNDVKVFNTVTITSTVEGSPFSIDFSVLDALVSPIAFTNALTFLSTQKTFKADQRFEGGVNFYSLRDIIRQTQSVSDSMELGELDKINYLSFRNQTALSEVASLLPYSLNISTFGTVTLSGFESGSLAAVSIAHSDFVGTGGTITGIGSDTITITGTLFSGLILRNASDVVLFEIEFSSLMTQYNADLRIGYCYKNRLTLFADGGEWVASDLVLNHQKKYLVYGGVVVSAGSQVLAYMANNWDTTNQYLTIDNFDTLATDADRLGLWKQITTTDGLVSKVTNEWLGADVAVPISVLSGNTMSSISNFSPNWNTARTDPSGSVSFTSLFYSATKTNLTTYGIYRFTFDIDTLGGQQLTSGSITLSKPPSAINSDSAYLYALTRDTPGTTGANDYDNFGAKLSDLATYDTVNESITFVLNAAGIAYVNAGSVSFMVRDWEDADNITPTEQANTFQNFTTFTTDFYKAAALIDFEQATAANRPQYGYDQTAIYDVATLADGSVTSFPNTATATARTMPTLTGTAGTEPTKAAGYLNFASGKKLNIANTSLTLRAFSVEFFGKATGFSASAAINSNIYFQCRKAIAGNNGFYLKLTKTGADAYSFVFFVGNGTNSVSLSTSSYTESQITALLANDTHVVARFLSGTFSILIDNSIVATSSSAIVTTCVIATVTDAFTSNEMSGVTLSMLYNRAYRSHLTDSEVGYLFAAKTIPTYQLPKFGIVSSGASIMKTLWIQNTLITDFSVGCWVYLQAVRDQGAVQTDQFILAHATLTTSTDKGFQLKIQNNAVGQSYFRFVVGNGIAIAAINSQVLARSVFKSTYLNKWTFVCATLKNQGATDFLTIYIDGVVATSLSVPAGSFYTSVDGEIKMFEIVNSGNNISAGNKLARPFMLTRALTASEIWDLHLTYATKAQASPYPHTWIEGSGNVLINDNGTPTELTYPLVVANASSIVYADSPTNHNIEQFSYGGTTYDVFEANESVMDTLTGVEIENGDKITLESVGCKYDPSCIKFKNRFGVWEYILFDAHSSVEIDTKGIDTADFANAEMAFGGKHRKRYTLNAPYFPIENIPTLVDLRSNPNVWFSEKWQFSSFYSTLEIAAAVDEVEVDTRLLSFTAPTANQFDLKKRFEVGDRVYFEMVEIPFTTSMWGEIISIINATITVRFYETDDNTGFSQIDTFVSQNTLLHVCAFDAWNLCKLLNVPDYEPTSGSINLIVEIEDQPQKGYDF